MASYLDTMVVVQKEDYFSKQVIQDNSLEVYSRDIIDKEKIFMSLD